MITKKQGLQERQIIEEMTAEFKKGKLTEQGRLELIRLKCRNELLTFCVVMSLHVPGDKFNPFPVHELICDFVQKSADGIEEYSNTTVSLPPRAGKSTIIGQYLIPFQIGRNPKARFIQGSHTLSLVERNSTRMLQIMNHPEYRKIFPQTKLVKKGLKLEKWTTTDDGGFLAATPRRGISGFDAGTLNQEDYPGAIILDDILASGDSSQILETTWNWTKSQLIPRALPNTVFMSMGTRYHVNDVTGRLIESNPDLWKTLNVPALCYDVQNDPLGRKIGESFWEEKYPIKSLKIKESAMGDEFKVIFQGQPAGSRGNMVFKDDLKYTPDVLRGNVFFSIDCNSKGGDGSDYNAVAVWSYNSQEGFMQMVDLFHSRCDFYNLLRNMKDLVRYWKPFHIIVEDKANGSPLISMLEREYHGINIHPYKPLTNKVEKFSLAVPYIKRGQVFFYNGISKKEEMENELLKFPIGSINDDIVDAVSMGILFWVNMILTGKVTTMTSIGHGLNLTPRTSPIDTGLLNVGDRRGMDTSWQGATQFL